MRDTFDFHCHTYLSDAAPEQSPDAVCAAARAAGVAHLCITDHDHVLSPDFCQRLSETYGLDVISGCEFSGVTALSTGRQVTVHVLGVWLPAGSSAIYTVLKHNQSQDFKGYAKAMLTKLLHLGIDPSGHGVEESFRLLPLLNPHTFHYGKNAVAHLLVRTGYVSSAAEAKNRYLSAFGLRMAYVPASQYCHYAPLESVMAAANTGLSVLCHLDYYQLTTNEEMELLYRFKELGGQALEVDYGNYTPARCAELMAYCDLVGLLPVASSDRHEADTPFKLGDPQWFRTLRERCQKLHGKEGKLPL